MKRPHRSIETFDISLMAVVTKAMGAFLVLMLLLMPYYTSEPMGQKEADALEKKVEEVNKNIQSAMDKLATAGAEDLRKQLEEALRQLAEARNLITDLKRMIDQLNAQVARLENENIALKSQVAELQKEVADLKAQVAALQKEVASLKAQVEQLQKENAELKAQVAQLRQENENLKALVAQLQKENEELKRIVDPLKAENARLKQENDELRNIVDPLKAQITALEAELEKLRGYVFMGQAYNWDCSSLKIIPGLASVNMYVSDTEKTASKGPNKDSKYVLNDSNGLGDAVVFGRPGYEQAQFFYRASRPGKFLLILVSRSDRSFGSRGGLPPLQRPARPCKILLSMNFATPNGKLRSVITNYVMVNDYVTLVADVDISPDGEVKTLPASPESAAWAQDQVAHADTEKAPAIPSGPGFGGGEAPPDPSGRIEGMKERFGPAAGQRLRQQLDVPLPAGTPPRQLPQGLSEQEQKALEAAPKLAPDAADKLRQGLRGSAQGLQEGMAKQKAPGASPQQGGGN